MQTSMVEVSCEKNFVKMVKVYVHESNGGHWSLQVTITTSCWQYNPILTVGSLDLTADHQLSL